MKIIASFTALVAAIALSVSPALADQTTCNTYGNTTVCVTTGYGGTHTTTCTVFGSQTVCRTD